MSNITHASIVPLIGGETLGAEIAHGRPPEFFLSFSPFKNNDKHIVNHYKNSIPYILLDEGGTHPSKVDVVHSVCPCAGLSRLSHGYGDHNENNKWLGETTKYVLNEMKPKVLWGENAPALAEKMGENVRNNMREIGREAGYTMSLYRTRTLLHGGCQVRERSFFFFWRGSKVPILNWYNKPHSKIEDVILSVSNQNFQTDPINTKTPTHDPYYKYVLENMHGSISHREFFDLVEPDSVRNANILMYIEKHGPDYLKVAKWMGENGFDKEVDKCKYRYDKLKAGNNIMRRCLMVPKDYIGAFVGHYPMNLTHPHEDRYINYREAMTIMGMPVDFELIDASTKNVNHICQNVPVHTAADMATEVVAVLNDERPYFDGVDYAVQYNHSQKIKIERYNDVSNTLENFF